MKLILCSEGFYTANTIEACAQLVGKPKDKISVAIINEGYAVEAGDKYWAISNLHNAATNFKGGVDLINLLALSIDEVKERISKRDVIFVVGGNIDYLMQVFNKSGFSKLLPELLKTKVYVGSSAGSIVLGRRLPTETYTAIYGGSRDEWEVYEYLGLVNFAFLSHLNSSTFPNNRADILREVCRNVDFPVYDLQDDSTIIIDGGSQKIIGSELLKIVDGRIV